MELGHHQVQSVAIHFGLMPTTRNVELAALMLSSILGPAVTAGMFAYPIARLYAHRSALAAILICIPTLIHRIFNYLDVTHLPWTNAMIFTQWICLIVLVPLAAWLVQRRLAVDIRE
jgi:hypothetical protein